MNNNNKEAVQKVIFGQSFLHFNGKRFSGFSNVCFSGELQIPLAPHRILCGPHELKKTNVIKM